MATKPARAQLRLEGVTNIGPRDCLALVRQAAEEAQPGANYAGQGLTLDITSSDSTSIGLAMVDRSRELCSFTAEVSVRGESTLVRVGGLEDCVVLRHSVMFIPVGSEIAGFGYYKRFLAAVQTALHAADPAAEITIGVPR